ncbi:MAG: DNA repair protein RecO, partial [Ginsengibacter sp.]
CLQIAQILGFGLTDNYSEEKNSFNLQEGNFSDENSFSAIHLNKELSYHISQLLKAVHPLDLQEVKMNRNLRREILKSLESYYSWHVQDFGSMKTLKVLPEILSE